MQGSNHSEGQGFTFIWRIENFRYCVESKGECLVSPLFSVCKGDKKLKETIWCLKLYPRGEDVETHVACYLQREESDDKSIFVSVNFELALVSPKGMVHSLCIQKRSIRRGQKYGIQCMKRDEIFDSEFLTQSNLTIRCHFSEIGKKPAPPGYWSALTRIGVSRNFFTWSLDRFSNFQIDQKTFRNVVIPFRSSHSLSISLFLSGESTSESRLKMEISKDPASHPIYVFLKTYILDVNRRQNFDMKDEFWFKEADDQSSIVWRFPFSIERKKLMKCPKMFLPKDTLSLGFEFTFSVGVDVHSVEFVSDKSEQFRISTVTSCEAEVDNPADLWFSDNKYCDAFICVQGESIPVYKLVLCKRSPVFRAMFEADMIEKETNCISIVDFDKETVNNFVRFLNNLLRRSEFSNLDWKSVVKLYKIADKYAVGELQRECLAFFNDNLTDSNVIDILVLADCYYDSELKEVAFAYLYRLDKHFFKCETWKNFKSSNHKLYTETITCLFNKCKEES